MNLLVNRFNSKEEVQSATLALISDILGASLQEQDMVSLVLSGGSNPLSLYRAIADHGNQNSWPWHRIRILLGDDRHVAWDDVRSNYGHIRQNLLSHIDIPKENIFPVPYQGSPDEDATRLKDRIMEVFGEMPSFDLNILGMGPDGHTASLFPGQDTQNVEEETILPVPKAGMEPLVPRVTMSLPLLNKSKDIIFYLVGEGKRDKTERILAEPEAAAADFPAARIRARYNLYWMIYYSD